MNNNKKNIVWNTLGTGINAFNSLFFMIIVTRLNGIEEAGIFTYAFSMSLVFNIIGTYYGRVYQVTDNNKFSDSDYFWNKIITCILMLIISLLFILFNGYSGKKFIIIFLLCLFRTFESFAEVLYAYYQKNNELYKVGISLVIKNVLGLIIFFIINYFTKNLILSIILLIINYLLIMLLYDFRVIKNLNIKLNNINKKNIFSILKDGFIPFILAFLIQILINIPRYIIDLKTTEELNTIWGILIMPASIMILIGQFCLFPFLNELTKLYEFSQIKLYLKKVFNISLFIFLFGLIGVIGAYFLGIPIFNFIYNIDLSDYKISLVIVIIGAVFYGIQNILYNLLIAMRKMKLQIIIYSLFIIYALILFSYFISKSKLSGACIAYLIVMITLLIVYIFLFLRYSLKEEKNDKNKCNSSGL